MTPLDHGPIFIVAGETSGDVLAAGLIAEAKRRDPSVRFMGIGGPKMRAAGCELIDDAHALAVMGFVEVIKHLPALFALRAKAKKAALAAGCRLFVGVDAPEFNLSLARHLARHGLRCVQYVSPQVWAWRSKRVFAMKRYLAHVLCLLPFECPIYDQADLKATFVGHPAADRLPLEPDRVGARRALGIAESATVLAVLPGSRRQEVQLLIATFLEAARLLQQRRGPLTVVIPVANDQVRVLIDAAVAAQPELVIQVIDGHSGEVLAASDVVLVASGTATLETLLSKRPMVVAYRSSALTAWLLRTFGLMKAPFFAQPNLLAGRRVVEEWFQEAVTPERLAADLQVWLDHPERVRELQAVFARIHEQLKKDASVQAAAVVMAEWHRSG